MPPPPSPGSDAEMKINVNGPLEVRSYGRERKQSELGPGIVHPEQPLSSSQLRVDSSAFVPHTEVSWDVVATRSRGHLGQGHSLWLKLFSQHLGIRTLVQGTWVSS